MDAIAHTADQGESNKRKARIIAAIFAILLLFLILYPFWSYTFPPPGQEGILVSFGQVEVGGGDVQNQNQKEKLVETPSEAEEENKQSKVFKDQPDSPKKSKVQESAVKVKSATQERSEVVVKEKAANLNKAIKSPKKPSEKDLALEREAAEAKKKAEYEEAKKAFSDLIGKGASIDQNTGNTGDPAGDPNTDVLTGISKGSGNVGGGLANRGLVFEPEIDENSQKSGKVVVKVCVDKTGKVVEAKYTQKGSTTTDTDLVNVAVSGAQRYKFSKSPIQRQCGTITIEFKLK